MAPSARRGRSANVYNGLGQRIQSQANNRTTNYLLDVQSPLFTVLRAKQGDGNPRWFVHGPLGVQQERSNGQNYQLLPDKLGSIVAEGNENGTDYTVNLHEFYDPYGKNQSSSVPRSPYDFAGEWRDPNGLIYLRSRFYHPGLGMFLSRDPVEGVLNRPMSLNGYSYVEGNPVNRVDPSGKVWWIPVLLLGALAASTVLKFADVIHQVDVKTRFEGKAFGTAWNELNWDSVQKNGQVGTLLGLGLTATSLVLPAGAAWLAANPIVAGGLVGGELEWARQFSINMSRPGMDVFHAGYYENIDKGQIALSAFWAATTAGIWDRAGVFSPIGKNGLLSVLNPQVLAGEFVPDLIPTATVYGSLGSMVSSRFSSAIINGQNITDFTWSDSFSSAFWGGLTGYLTASYQVSTNPISRITRSDSVLRPTISSQWGFNSLWQRGVAYAGIGLLTSIPQSIISSISGKSSPSCSLAYTPASALANVASMLENDWRGYLAAGVISSAFVSVRTSTLCRP